MNHIGCMELETGPCNLHWLICKLVGANSVKTMLQDQGSALHIVSKCMRLIAAVWHTVPVLLIGPARVAEVHVLPQFTLELVHC